MNDTKSNETKLVSFIIGTDPTVKFDYLTEAEYITMKDRNMTEIGLSEFAVRIGRGNIIDDE